MLPLLMQDRGRQSQRVSGAPHEGAGPRAYKCFTRETGITVAGRTTTDYIARETQADTQTPALAVLTLLVWLKPRHSGVAMVGGEGLEPPTLSV